MLAALSEASGKSKALKRAAALVLDEYEHSFVDNVAEVVMRAVCEDDAAETAQTLINWFRSHVMCACGRAPGLACPLFAGVAGLAEAGSGAVVLEKMKKLGAARIVARVSERYPEDKEVEKFLGTLKE